MTSAPDLSEDWPAQARTLLRRLRPELVLEDPRPASGPIMVLGTAGSGKTELVAALREEAPELAVHEVAENAVATSAMAGASAALVLFDVGAPADKTDMAVVRAAAATTHHVVFALTKTDAHEGWRATQARDQQMLEELGPRFASAALHPVSARLYHLAMDAHDPLHIRQWSEASGLRPLAAELRRIARIDLGVRTRQNWLRQLDGQLSSAGLRLQDPAEEERLIAEHHRVLRERTQEQRNQNFGHTGRRDTLRSELQLARVDLAVELNSTARSTAAQTREAVARSSGRQLGNLMELVKPKIVELDQKVTRSCWERLTQIAHRVVGDLGSLDTGTPSRVTLHPPEHLEPPPIGSWGMEDLILVLLGVSAGLGLGKYAVQPFAQVPWIATWSTPVVAGLGLLVAMVVVFVRRLSSGRQRAGAWAQEAVAYRRGQLEQAITAELLHAEVELGRVLDGVFARRRQAAERRMDELEQQAKDIALRLTRLRSDRDRDRMEIFRVRKGLVALANAPDARP